YYYPEGKHRSRRIPEKESHFSKYDAIILSDAPSRFLGKKRMKVIQGCVEEGTGLGMIGGWESFTGLEGGYKNTPIEEALPVECSSEDDRRNVSGGLKIIKKGDHPILEGLPWTDTPTVCGYNLVAPKDSAFPLLTLKEIISSGTERVEKLGLSDREDPLLVVGEYKKGRTLAFTTDIAPHWVGGLVDWGDIRVRCLGAEIGNLYVRFLGQMLFWLGKV
ncbi:glutamine amidotransferase, partial [[Eubacterium] cellulosolvens]